MTFDDVVAIAMQWPGMEESTSYGTRALKANKKLVARLREDGDTLVILGVPVDERELLIEARPRLFYTTPHYDGHPSVLVRLGKARAADITHLLKRRWRAVAPKKVVREFDAQR